MKSIKVKFLLAILMGLVLFSYTDRVAYAPTGYFVRDFGVRKAVFLKCMKTRPDTPTWNDKFKFCNNLSEQKSRTWVNTK